MNIPVSVNFLIEFVNFLKISIWNSSKTDITGNFIARLFQYS